MRKFDLILQLVQSNLVRLERFCGPCNTKTVECKWEAFGTCFINHSRCISPFDERHKCQIRKLMKVFLWDVFTFNMLGCRHTPGFGFIPWIPDRNWKCNLCEIYLLNLSFHSRKKIGFFFNFYHKPESSCGYIHEIIGITQTFSLLHD